MLDAMGDVMKTLYLERALFVVGHQRDGKSTQLRSIFKDWRFGTQGKVPTTKKLDETYSLSHDRGLYMRLTSPHEYRESPAQFHEKIRKKTGDSGRWVFASALQPDASHQMPDVVETVKLFVAEFSPERVRLCFLSPNQWGDSAESDISPLVKRLWKVDACVECVTVDATHKTRNGLFFSDFLSFY